MGKSSAAAKSLGQLSNEIFGLLESLTPEDRAKVISAVMSLFGEAFPPSGGGHQPQQGGASHNPSNSSTPAGSLTAQQYWASKQPKNKGEMLAVAAKFREEKNGDEPSTRDDFATFFSDARQNFDKGNFLRDMRNAQLQAHLFNKGTARGQYQLSFYGQQYVDALPDREMVKKLKRPGRKVKTKKSAKTQGAK
jgi:hypothetical protein